MEEFAIKKKRGRKPTGSMRENLTFSVSVDRATIDRVGRVELCDAVHLLIKKEISNYENDEKCGCKAQGGA